MSNPFTDAIEGPSGPPSLMRPRRESLALGAVLAVILHAGVLFVGLCIGVIWQPTVEPVRPQDSIEVSMMVLPRAERMPEKAMHKASSGRASPAPTVATAPTTSSEPTPPNPSDLALHDPNAKPEPADKRDHKQREDLARKREEAMRQMMMEDALADLDSPEGPKDRQATDPNSTSEERIDLGGSGVAADPEWVAYLAALKKLYAKEFHPLPSIVAANPRIVTEIRLKIDVDTGAVLSADLASSSGNDSYDSSATSAAAAVSQVPLPPERFREKARGGFIMKFTPP